MNHPNLLAFAVAVAYLAGNADAQVITGRVLHPKSAEGADTVPFPNVLCFASQPGTLSEPVSFKTWETAPAGWFKMPASEGRHTLLCTAPASVFRPIIRTNLFLKAGETWDSPIAPRFDFASFDDGAWDDKPATDYFQTFVARGTGVTQLGFKLAHDGVDGAGPKSQNLLATIHRRGQGTPDTWEQVGPATPILEVDAGGVKNSIWSAGWNSGEVPLTPGETYAVHLRAETPGRAFQAFWRPAKDQAADCYRLGEKGDTGFRGRQLWMAVATDGDGLLIPYNKRIHKQFGQLTNCVKRWTQTYVSQGRGLAGVILYAAVSGAQPQLARQRIVVRVRKGGPEGDLVGAEKIAVGNGNYTGDASWGVFGCAFAPGEIPLEPKQTYAIEMESIENYETLHGFINIKGEVSNDRPGFNPYRKHARDIYAQGTAYRGGEKEDFSLDMQILEYAHAAKETEWSLACEPKNLLANGDMEAGELHADDPTAGKPAAWKTFAIDAGAVPAYLLDLPEGKNRFLRVLGGSYNKKTADGGFVQRVDELSPRETYRLSGKVRSSWPLSDARQCFVGIDLTGQIDDPQAKTIQWTPLPKLHGLWVSHAGEPVRPTKTALSVWLRGRTISTQDTPFKADFDDFQLNRIRTDVPDGS